MAVDEQKDPRTCKPCFAAAIAKLAATPANIKTAALADELERTKPTGCWTVVLALTAIGYPIAPPKDQSSLASGLIRGGWEIVPIGTQPVAGDVVIGGTEARLCCKHKLNDEHKPWMAFGSDQWRSGAETCVVLRRVGP